MDIACVGEMVIDFLPGDEAGVYLRKAGGAPANVAIAAARNNLDSGFCGRVGNDDFGRFLFGILKANRVSVLCPKLVDEAITTMAFVTLDDKGDRSFTFARKPGADMFLTRDDVDRAGIRDALIVHAGSCSLSRLPASDATRYALGQGKKAGRMISFDVNYRNLLWDDDREAAAKAVREILPLVDFLKISEEEADMIGGEENLIATAASNGISVIVETLGSKGARAFWNGHVLNITGIKSECVDATGAGDAFWGAFLSSLIRSGIKSADSLTKEILTRALMYGNVAGSLCVRKKGAIESLPTADEIESFLKGSQV